ncbi:MULTISPECIES: amino acid ABC transporter substrate-binding protein [unclassified Bacillus (in: firmicutes)]|uniref:amino acid ABC transporter substrate-binding protein n=1 Tax=unclassified Bacillus (in: firmicutes) TaxID=185979 RepID=UPI001BE7C963|nr:MULTISPECIES: amino acid ABC transporter substrate-binding protein [unclassified Bacillus (in: firmicutes)]MBT2639993.1 amino acid ABC transporter substrate-binding protein [Bacillus sp. ISL-39]MBT2662867.1 amino acid ABC transporter substrate-binding protein [Bacillus sp. ISL-45]
MKKLSFLLILILTAVLLISGCGGQEKDDKVLQGNDATEEENSVLAKVEKEGKLLVGTEGTYPPFTFHDKDGNLTGFDVDIAKEVAKRLGVQAEFKETQWDAMFAGLDAKRFDMVANQVGIKPEREEKYLFSSPYITSTAVLIAHEDNNELKGFEDLKGKKAAQSMTSNYADIARENGAEIVGVDGFNQSIELILSKRVDATINENLSFLDFKKAKPDAKVKIIAESEDASKSGLMFRKDSDTLVEAVNGALADMIADGTYDKISLKWFDENVLE